MLFVLTKQHPSYPYQQRPRVLGCWLRIRPSYFPSQKKKEKLQCSWYHLQPCHLLFLVYCPLFSSPVWACLKSGRQKGQSCKITAVSFSLLSSSRKMQDMGFCFFQRKGNLHLIYLIISAKMKNITIPTETLLLVLQSPSYLGLLTGDCKERANEIELEKCHIHKTKVCPR